MISCRSTFVTRISKKSVHHFRVFFFNEVLTEEFFSPPFETPRGVLSSSMADVRWAPVVDMHTSKVNSDRIRSPRFWASDLGVGWWGGGSWKYGDW